MTRRSALRVYTLESQVEKEVRQLDKHFLWLQPFFHQVLNSSKSCMYLTMYNDMIFDRCCFLTRRHFTVFRNEIYDFNKLSEQHKVLTKIELPDSYFEANKLNNY